MSEAKPAKKKRGKKGKKKTGGFSLLYVGLPLLVVGLVLTLISASLQGSAQSLLVLVGLVPLVAGVLFCGVELWGLIQPALQKEIELGKDAVRLLRGQQKKLIGELPYSNIATVEIDEHITIIEDENGFEVDDQRETVVAIQVFRVTDGDTYWPYRAGDRDGFDFFIPSDIASPMTRTVSEIEARVYRYREKKTRRNPQGD
jgi:hypothetical protein